MQRYCEPYFVAIENWMKYDDRSILINRLQLIESACDLFKQYSEKPGTYVFELICSNNDAPLLQEVIPSAGKHFVVGGDTQAYTAVKERLPENLFSKAGVYFQSSLLKAMAGWNATVLAASNMETRKSLVLAVEKLFRLPQESGVGHFTIREVRPGEPIEMSEHFAVKHICAPVSQAGQNLFDFLIQFEADRKEAAAAKLAKKKQKNTGSSSGNTSSASKKKHTEEEDDTGWLSKHSSIGAEVAAYFPPEPAPGVTRKLFTGVVVKYLPATSAEAGDQLYHILWEDGDEQDYDEKDLVRGIEQHDLMNGWVTAHPSIGINVAASFPVASGGRGGGGHTTHKVFKGVVLKYAPPTSETESDQLYHVVWEDGDEQDYDEEDLQKGIQLYHETYENGGGVRSGNRNSSSSSSSSSAKNTPVKKQQEEEEVEEVEVVEKRGKKEEQREKEEDNADDEVEIVEPPPRSRNRSGSHSQTTNSSSSSSSSSGYKPEPTSGTKRQRGSEEDGSPVKSKPAAAPSSSVKKAKTTSTAVKSSSDNDEPVWVTMHSVIGTKVCAYFPCASNDPDGVYPPSKKNAKGKKFKPYDGEVTKFAYESAPGENDQLYHVVWEDGDEEDLFQAEFDEAKELFVNLNWHRERGHFGKK